MTSLRVCLLSRHEPLAACCCCVAGCCCCYMDPSCPDTDRMLTASDVASDDDDVTASGVEDEDDVIDCDRRFRSHPKSRKIRTCSYRRAIKTPPKITTPHLLITPPPPAQQVDPLRSEQNNNILYQKVKERGVVNDDYDLDFLPLRARNHSRSPSPRHRLAATPPPSSPRNAVTSPSPNNTLSRRRTSSLRQSWAEQDHVIRSGVLEKLSSRERKRQEAMFELFTSEASYLHSLHVLIDCFMTSQTLRSCVTSTEYHHLFSNVDSVRQSSESFYSSLHERRHASPVAVVDVCDVIIEHCASGTFDPYVTYCSNENYQQRAFDRLMEENPQFVQEVRTLESSEECWGLPFHSFLLLPMQRITRLPLLVDTIRQRCDVTTPQHVTASRALRVITNLVRVCNERAKSLERTEQMIRLQQQLEFRSRSFAVISSSRYLLKSGHVIKWSRDENVFGFRRKSDLHLFLFNDVLLIAKKKTGDSFMVSEHCHRDDVDARDVINNPLVFLLIVAKNQEGNRTEMKVEADRPNTVQRWLHALKPRHSYDVTDRCLQVEVVRSLTPDEPDMASLKTLDVFFVHVATPDGWYLGERLTDGCRGWFPAHHSRPITCEKTRENNLRRRTRLLTEQADL